ncbi:hypothetical protein JCM30795_17750 [Agathobaculum butyriciproducens]
MGAVHIRSRTFTYHKKLLIFDYALLIFMNCPQCADNQSFIANFLGHFSVANGRALYYNK